MAGVYTLFFTSFLYILNQSVAQNYDWFTNSLEVEDYPIGQQMPEKCFTETKIQKKDGTVDLKLYYESLCPGCIYLDRHQFKNVVTVLSPYLDIKTYPYGNAQTMETNGEVEFKCQHGPDECYGNQLHACSLKHITNHTEALLFNICLMSPNDESNGSDDAAAKKCAREMNVNKDAIFQCAKGKEGIELHKYYGEETKKVNLTYVPYVLINGVLWEGDDLMKDVCAAFQNPPEVCQQ